MKRRQLIRYAGASSLAAIALNKFTFGQVTLAQDNSNPPQANSERLTIQYFGHTCFLFTGSGLEVLVNPFRPVGCTAGYTLPNVQPDLVLVSSFLLDEGAVEEVEGNPEILTEPGDRQIQGTRFQGISMPHDREGGRRFGRNIAWRWTQAGVDILHLGGAAAPITTEEQILLGSPDVLLVPVGGGPKAYNPTEAKQAIDTLKPRMVIPTQYLTAASDSSNCDLVSVDSFLDLTADMEVQQLDSDRISFQASDLASDRTLVRVLDYS